MEEPYSTSTLAELGKMVSMNELDSFVGKFRQLWKEGFNASLHVESKAEKASISLTVVLGNENYQNVKPFYSSRRTEWRHARNCAAKVSDFKVKENRKSSETNLHDENVVAAEVIKNSSVATVNSVDTNLHDENIVTAEVIKNSSVATVNSIDTGDDAYLVAAEATMISSDANIGMDIESVEPEGQSSIIAGEANKCESLETEITDNVSLLHKEGCIQINDTNDNVLSENMQKGSNESKGSLNNKVNIHATAVLNNSPFSRFDQEEKESILRCIAAKDHLRRNIEDVEFCNSSSRMCSNNLYQHNIDVVFLVRTGALWESPRSYVWKHLGQEGWRRGNGTTIHLSRIHQK